MLRRAEHWLRAHEKGLRLLLFVVFVGCAVAFALGVSFVGLYWVLWIPLLLVDFYALPGQRL